jgi:type IV pilus assembly protein PilV
MQLKHHPMFSRARGFSLIEVLVALLVISIGLLGIAKMQALALANTNGGRLRALAAIEAASLAASMQAERSYWGNLASSETITITSASTAGTTTVSSPNDSTLAGSVTCPASTSTNSTTMNSCTVTVTCTTASPCTAQQMAAYDVQQWAGRLQEIMGPSAAASIACTVTTPAPPPVSCQITVNWYEETVNSNTTETGTMAIPSYTLFVNP